MLVKLLKNWDRYRRVLAGRRGLLFSCVGFACVCPYTHTHTHTMHVLYTIVAYVHSFIHTTHLLHSPPQHTPPPPQITPSPPHTHHTHQGEAIAVNLREMFGFRVPIISVVIGEGGSGGALAIGCANRTLIMENAVYYVASPEACAAILWKSRDKAGAVWLWGWEWGGGVGCLLGVVGCFIPCCLCAWCLQCSTHAAPLPNTQHTNNNIHTTPLTNTQHTLPTTPSQHTGNRSTQNHSSRPHQGTHQDHGRRSP